MASLTPRRYPRADEGERRRLTGDPAGPRGYSSRGTIRAAAISSPERVSG
ncbi:MAG: hypothetical protein ACXVHX_31200 [Solirubrobacteraceae bacterium]